MRLSIPLALLILGLACKPPLDLNTTPTANLISPAADRTFNEGTFILFTLEVDDRDDDDPLSVLITDLDPTGATRTLFEQEVTISADPINFEVGDLVPGTHQITVEVDDGRTDGVRIIEQRLTINGSPSEPVIEIQPAVPTPGDDLIAVLATPSSDPEGDPLGYSWEWVRERDSQVFISGTTFPAVLPASATEAGETWIFEVTAFEADNSGLPKPGGITVFTFAEVTLNNAPPTAPTSAEVLPSNPHPAQDLRCAASGSTDPEEEVVSYRYAWARDTGSGFVVQPAYTGAVLPSSATSPGESWRCLASGWDGVQAGPQTSADAIVRGDLDPADEADLWVDGLAGAGVGTASSFWNFHGTATADALAISAPGSAAGGGGSGAFYLLTPAHIGSLSAIDAIDGQAVVAGAGQGFGRVLALTPDVSLDGNPDLMVSADGDDGGVWVVPSSAVDGAGVPPDNIAAQGMNLLPDVGTGFGQQITAGRLNGDATVDFVVAQERGASTPNVVWVVDGVAPDFASSSTISLTNAARITSRRADDTFGHSLAANGDFNGDGTLDLAIGAVRPAEDNERLAVALFSGLTLTAGADHDEDDAFVSVGHNPGSDAGKAVGFFPDLDADDADELWVTAPGFASGRGRLLLFLGGTTVAVDLDPLNFDQALVIEGLDEGGRFGEQAIVLGDLGSDGLPELAVSAPGAASGAGKVYLFEGTVLAEAVASAIPGTPAQLDAGEASWVLVGSAPGDGLGLVGVSGDFDGDGFADLMLGSPDASNGRVYTWLSGR
jgi:hypothetical protein